MIAFDGLTFARGWLSVSLAASEDSDRPQLYRAVLLEEFDTGARLISTDSYWLAHTFVPSAEHSFIDEPGLDEAPTRSTIVRDVDRLGKQLLEHVVRITKDEDADPVEVTVDVALGLDDDQPSLSPELGATRVRLDLPGSARVALGTYEADYVQVARARGDVGGRLLEGLRDGSRRHAGPREDRPTLGRLPARVRVRRAAQASAVHVRRR